VSWQLVAEVLDHAPRHLSPQERLVLTIIAEYTRDAHGRTSEQSIEDLAWRAGLTASGAKQVLAKLDTKGVPVRVPRGVDKHGKPVYTVRGQVPRYRLPEFPPPPGCPCATCKKDGSDEPPSGGSSQAPSPEKVPGARPEGGSDGAVRRLAQATPPVPGIPVSSPGEGGSVQPPSVRSGERTDVERLADEIGATADEVTELVRRLAVERPNVSSPIAWLRRCHQSGDLAPMLREQRAERMRNQIARELEQARRDRSMECEHGTPAGRYRRPDTGKSPCAQCRHAKAEV
jgi:hypothetical protein